ncbi:hypothetical protein TNCV_3742821 [Trichonephila clavipes]|nr:hypothetical protein TNCV_3742821 [Trichonephila clavipes]
MWFPDFRHGQSAKNMNRNTNTELAAIRYICGLSNINSRVAVWLAMPLDAPVNSKMDLVAQIIIATEEEGDRWEALENLPQNWGGTEPNHHVTCLVLKATVNDMCTSSSLPRRISWASMLHRQTADQCASRKMATSEQKLMMRASGA